MTGPVFVGVRHHSPACARLVAHELRRLRPRLVLVEGPSDDGGHLGRTPENRVVHLESHGRELDPGSLVRARVVRSGHSSLGAEIGS